MTAAAEDVVWEVSPSPTGVFYLDWDTSREDTYSYMLQRGWADEHQKGWRFFVTLRGTVSGLPALAHFQFADGLHATEFIFHPESEDLRDDLRKELTGRYGTPVEEQVHLDGQLQRRIWHYGETALLLDTSPLYAYRLLCRRQDYPQSPSPMHGKRGIVLEDLAPSQMAIREAAEANENRQSGRAAGRRRLILGSCPACGLVLDTGHAPRCDHASGDEDCVICKTRPASINTLCLSCTREELVRSLLIEAGDGVVPREHESAQDGEFWTGFTWARLGTAGLLLLALLSLPYAFYTALRWAVTIVASWGGWMAYEQDRTWWLLALGALAVLFNPIAPIPLDRGTWAVLDVLSAGLLIVSVFRFRPD